jgi:hypothetical protein
MFIQITTSRRPFFEVAGYGFEPIVDTLQKWRIKALQTYHSTDEITTSVACFQKSRPEQLLFGCCRFSHPVSESETKCLFYGWIASM